MLDLQLLTILRFLRTYLPSCRGRLLDVGAGEAPWKDLLTEAEYTGVDVEAADEFGMRRKPSITYYDGRRLPFADGSFNHVLCTEVLEHVSSPAAFLADLHRVLCSGGSLILTVPWAARLHHLPHDYHRFTRYGLSALLNSVGFLDIQIYERGNDVAVVANKLLVMNIRLLRPKRRWDACWTWLLAAIASPITVGFLIAAHFALLLHLGSKEDPLGYGVIAAKG